MSEESSSLAPGGGGGGAENVGAPDRPNPHDSDVLVDDIDDDPDPRVNAGTVSLRTAPKKRRRTVISCIECHRRKQKCDRKLPCANCISRHKQDSCEYESGAPTAREQQKRRAVEDNTARSTTTRSVFGDHGSQWQEDPSSEGSTSYKPVNFGYSQTGASTLGFLQKLEDAQSPLSHLNPDNIRRGDPFNTRERYKTLIRQLPARTYIEKLVDIYFIEFNWQYQGLDRDVFDNQLQAWYRLPFHLLTTGGPQALEPNLRAFPALLFQVLALALLFLHPGSDPVFESLKYAGSMSFEDLAVDYSESGMSILSLLGKRQMTITNVHAGFLRASFLKYVALVTESWHAIGSAIRDGQEIGLHRDSLDPKPANDTPEAILENQWEIQRRRKLWATLIWWDMHTAVVLGRPTTIDHFQEQQFTLPIDAKMNILATSSSSSPPSPLPVPLVPRTESDPPTPLSRLLFAVQLGNQLRSILTIEKTLGPNPHSFAPLDTLHSQFLSIESLTPAWLRLENPDTRFDSRPECYWIPYARAQMPQMLAFNLMALHRPYIFTRQVSRTEALKASLGMLQAQRYHFASLKPQQYKMFSLFFGTFDAIVIVAAVYILFPRENREYVRNAVQHFRWAVERFTAMSGRNALAKAALGVLKAMEVRFVRSVGLPGDAITRGLGKGGGGCADGARKEVPPPVTNAGLMPLPWADGDRPAPEGPFAVSSGVVSTGGSTTDTSPSACGSMASPSGSARVANIVPKHTGSANAKEISGVSSSVSPAGGLIPDYLAAPTNPHAGPSLGFTTTTSNGPSPSSSSSPSNGSRSVSSGHSNETTRETARSWSYNTTSTPSVMGGIHNSPLFDPGTGAEGQNNWDWNLNLPSDFDWSSLQPIFATGDLLYNDLQLQVVGGGDAWEATGDGRDDSVSAAVGNEVHNLWAGGGGCDGSRSGQGITTTQERSGNMNQGTGVNTDVGDSGGDINMLDDGVGAGNSIGGGGNNEQAGPPGGDNSNNNMSNAWLFEGDFSNDSFWSLLNQFGPPPVIMAIDR